MMKKLLFTFTTCLLSISTVFAHYLWVETNPTGILGQPQEVRVYFGEYTYGVIEDTEGTAFAKMKDFSLWVVDATGKKTLLNTTAKEDHFIATFTPQSEGVYTVTLDNDKIDVIDYTQYDFGIFKTHYHSVATIQVGDANDSSIANNKKGLSIKKLSAEKGKVVLQVFYKNEVLPKAEVSIFVADQWSKKMETDEKGMLKLDLPLDTQYVLEVNKKEEVPGKYKEVPYEFIWHCVTYHFNQ